MQSDHLNCKQKGGAHSNGVTGDMDGLRGSMANGHGKREGEVQNGSIKERLEHKRKKERRMTPMEKDIISLIGQHLRENGYGNTLDSLIEESGCSLEHPMAGSFRRHILLGQWKEALVALDELSPLLGDPYCIEKMKLLLLEEKFLEHLENGEKMMALHCLRHDLVSLPIHHPGKRIQDLSQYLMYESQEDLYRLSNWPGVKGGARQRLLDQLQAFLPPSIMLPPKRLELLLRQSVQLQVDKCPFHYTESDISCYSLLTDHICQRSHFPSETVHTLKAHSDEVWFVQFSHDGTRLVSGSKDGNIIIWRMEPSETPTKILTLKGQSSGVTSLLWSPDDALLLSCGTEDCPEVIVFDSKTGEEKCRVSNSPDDSLTCGCWHHSSKKFYVGGLRGQFYECSSENGAVINSWDGIRLHAVASHPCTNLVFAADSHLRIRRYNFEERISSTLVKEEHPIMAFTLSRDARYALLNVASQGVHMWDLVDRCMIRRYQGVTQGYYTIHSCFGINDTFIASGSEDNHVYVWNKKRETPVIMLQGHTRTVNSVCWNPTYHSMIVSASDDCTIRVWGTDDEMKQQRERERLKLKQRKQRKKEEATENGEESQEDTTTSVDETDTHSTSDDRDDHQQTDDIEMQDQQQNYERLSRPVSEMDLQALEMLDPDSSSQEENSNDRLEAAVSLSTLSVGLRHPDDIILNTENTSRILSSPSRRVAAAANMLVIMSSEGFNLSNEEEVVERGVGQHVITMPPIILTHTHPEMGPVDLDSSMESEESSRHLESFHSVLSENDPSTDQNITVITSLPPREEGEGEEGVREEVPLSDSRPGGGGGDNLSPSDSDTNGTSSSRTRSRLRERDDSTPRSIATESSVSTIV